VLSDANVSSTGEDMPEIPKIVAIFAIGATRIGNVTRATSASPGFLSFAVLKKFLLGLEFARLTDSTPLASSVHFG
jgi:hypothetical protein